EGARQFVGANPVLGIGDQPQGGKPLLERQRRVLKQSADLQRELRFGVLRVALPPLLSGEIDDVIATAGRATDNTIRPSHRDDGLMAVLIVREKQDCFLESLWRVRGSHEQRLPEPAWLVN